MFIPGKFRCAFFGRRTTCAPTQSRSDPEKKSQVDVFPLVFVSVDDINVSALLNTDLFMKVWVSQLHAADHKQHIRIVRDSTIFIFFGKSVIALTLGSIALTKIY